MRELVPCLGRIGAISLFVVFVWTTIVPRRTTMQLPSSHVDLELGQARRRQTQRSPERQLVSYNETRPSIYTFYYQIPPDEYRGTGMSDEDDQRLLMEWKSFWREAGWNPKVLGIHLAQKHPYYSKLMQSLEGLPFRLYDKLCFVRWLAVVQEGGGFLSDYDTFPLHDFRADGRSLPNRGELTVYANHVPAMVSGTAEEYWRVLHLMVENAQQHQNEQHWSDMLALADLYHQSNGHTFHRHRDVMNGDRVLNGVPEWSDRECHLTRSMRAVHFSHKAMRQGKLGFDAHAKDRPNVARQWLEMWQRQCPHVEIMVTATTDDLPPAKKSPSEHVARKYSST